MDIIWHTIIIYGLSIEYNAVALEPEEMFRVISYWICRPIQDVEYMFFTQDQGFKPVAYT